MADFIESLLAQPTNVSPTSKCHFINLERVQDGDASAVAQQNPAQSVLSQRSRRRLAMKRRSQTSKKKLKELVEQIVRRVRESLLLFVLVLLLLLATAATKSGGSGFLLQVNNQPRPGLFLIPLEASQVWVVELIIGLCGSVMSVSWYILDMPE